MKSKENNQKNGKLFRKKRADDLRPGDYIQYDYDVYKVTKVIQMEKVPHTIVYCELYREDCVNVWLVMELENSQMIYYK